MSVCLKQPLSEPRLLITLPVPLLPLDDPVRSLMMWCGGGRGRGRGLHSRLRAGYSSRQPRKRHQQQSEAAVAGTRLVCHGNGRACMHHGTGASAYAGRCINLAAGRWGVDVYSSAFSSQSTALTFIQPSRRWVQTALLWLSSIASGIVICLLACYACLLPCSFAITGFFSIVFRSGSWG